jgi:hypothetical protein
MVVCFLLSVRLGYTLKTRTILTRLVRVTGVLMHAKLLSRSTIPYDILQAVNILASSIFEAS